MPTAPTDPCGSNGEACTSCPSGDTCFAGGCMHQTTGDCTPFNCSGCCFNPLMPLPNGTSGGSTECFEGTQAFYCGSGGSGCEECAPSMNGGHCVADSGVGGQCEDIGTCNASNCAGCCAGNICAVGTQDVACGLGGVPCQDCTADGGLGLCLDLMGAPDGEHRLCGYDCIATSPPTQCAVWCTSATDCTTEGDVGQL